MHESEKWKGSHSVVSDSVQPHRWHPTRLPRPWDSPGKNTGVGCHFLLQCMKVKSESKVIQSCPTLSYPMDCSPPDSSIHGIFQARVLEWGAIAFSKKLLILLNINKNVFKWKETYRLNFCLPRARDSYGVWWRCTNCYIQNESQQGPTV